MGILAEGLKHERIRPDEGILAYFHPWRHDCIYADPDVVAERDLPHQGRGDSFVGNDGNHHALVEGIGRHARERVYLGARAHDAIVADEDAAISEYHAVLGDMAIFSDTNLSRLYLVAVEVDAPERSIREIEVGPRADEHAVLVDVRPVAKETYSGP